MTADERTLIANLFDRLKQAGGQAKDADADEYIRARVSEQPASPYLLVQSTLVMQQALAAAQGKIAALEKKLAEASAPREEPGFLSGVANLFGVGPSSQQPAAPAAPAPPPIPSRPAPAASYALPTPPQPNPGGGFLQTALSTAAGVAGGALLFQGIENLIGHNPGPFSGLSGPSGGVIGSQPPVENTEVVNNYFETNEPDAAGQVAERDEGSTAFQEENPLSDPGFDDPSRPDDGGDFAGGDDDSYV